MTRDFQTGLERVVTRPPAVLGPLVDISGNVIFVSGYAVANFVGCQATLSLVNAPDTWFFVVTSEQRLQSLLESAYATGKTITVRGQKFVNQPINHFDGQTWTPGADVYSLAAVFMPMT